MDSLLLIILLHRYAGTAFIVVCIAGKPCSTPILLYARVLSVALARGRVEK